jgi:membrane-associated protein
MFDTSSIIQSGGLLLIAIIIFAESGMMVGFFFPGDTLLFSAGIFAAQGTLPLIPALLVIAAAAIAGDNIGYHIGRTFGPRLFRKKDGLIFRHDYIMRAEKFYETYGAKTMLVAHFVPVVRTFAPVVAGAARMERTKFVLFDAIGDTVWAFSIILAGYWFGSKIPGIEHYVEPVLLAVVAITLLPTIYHALKDPKIRIAIKSKITGKKPDKAKTDTKPEDL